MAEMTQPRVAVGGGEPQLAVKSTGRQRWGPATFSPPSVQSPAATLVSSSTGLQILLPLPGGIWTAQEDSITAPAKLAA